MADRLRELLDLVLASLDDPDADGRALAGRAGFSRDHLDRVLAAATGETPVALRRRLLLERAAWQLRAATGAPVSTVASAAGFGSLPAFSRAFARAYGVPPSRFDGEVALPAPNGIHFHPPAGLLLPGLRASRGLDLTDRLVGHHLDRTAALLRTTATLDAEQRVRPLRPGLVVVWFEGEEPSADVLAERLVAGLEVWVAAVAGREPPPRPGGPDRVARWATAAAAFARLVRTVRERGAWDDGFVDALCEPPESFTYGGVIAHVLSYGAVRRELLAGVLAELGADVDAVAGDAIMWERRSRGV